MVLDEDTAIQQEDEEEEEKPFTTQEEEEEEVEDNRAEVEKEGRVSQNSIFYMHTS